MEGSDRNDWIFGFGGNDTLIGNGGNDTIFASWGNDTINGGSGNDTIFGGSGFDTALYAGGIADYNISTFWHNSLIKVSSNTAVPDAGRDTLFKVEALFFAADDFTLYLNGTNNAVLAADDTAATEEGTALTLDAATLLANDQDFDGDTMTITSVSATSAGGGNVTLSGTEISYDPGTAFDYLGNGETATDTFTYTVDDGRGGTDTATVTVTITGTNEAPTLTTVDAATLTEGSTDIAAVIAAADPDGDALSYSISGGADAGLFSINAATGVVSFLSAPVFADPQDAGADNTYDLEITVSDGQGGAASSDLAITVEAAAAAITPRINEVHYDNTGGDIGEFVEVRVAAGADVSGLVITAYNGNGGSAYNSFTLDSAPTSDGTYDYYTVLTPGLQNGSPDGIALSDDGELIEFLSYEGTFTAAGGPADGVTSTDMGQFEAGTTPVGFSLQRDDTGAWNPPAEETPGAANTGGSTPTDGPRINEFHYDNISSDTGEFIEVRLPAGTDPSTMLVELYNGSNGTVYNTLTLDAAPTSDGSYDYYVIDLPANGMQNGSPDGIALSDGGTLVEFLSYEGTLTGVGGAADGVTSTDIGQEESGSTEVGFSLQRNDDGSWDAPAAETKGEANDIVIPAVPTYAIGAISEDQLEGDSGTTTYSFTVTRDGDASAAGSVDFSLTGDLDADDFGGALPSGTLTFAAGQTSATFSFTVLGDETVEDDETLEVTLSNPVGGEIAAGEGSASSIVLDDDDITLISEIQGSGGSSDLIDQIVTVEAVVTHVVSNGFYIQEEDADSDGNDLTSEGIFVFTGGETPPEAGDRVVVRGAVEEYFEETQLDAFGVEVTSSDNDLPTAASVLLGPDIEQNFEAIEGMLFTLESGVAGENITVTQNFNLDRFGEITVSAGTLTQATQLFDAQTQAAEVADWAAGNANNSLLISDGSSVQNPDALTYVPNDTAGDNGNGYLDSGDTFTEDGPTIRLGAEIDGPTTGVMAYAFGEYQMVVTDVLNIDQSTNTGAREDAPADVGGTLQIASINVLNYFTTLVGEGTSGPNGLSPRGAASAEDLVRQTDKLVATFMGTEAEVFALQEIENNGFADGSAIDTLTDALNAQAAIDGSSAVYAYADPTGGDPDGYIGTDAITTGIIYDSTKVQLVHTEYLVFEETSADATYALAEVLNAVVPAYAQLDDNQRNRPAVAATFVDLETGEEFTVVSNHFKSKGDSGLSTLVEAAQDYLDAGGTEITQADIDALIADPNYDQGDGQGSWNAVRADAAAEVKDWMDTAYNGTGTDSYVIMGDMNAYAMEDPVQTLADDPEMTDLIDAYIGQDVAYSYVFDGQQGTLDQALASDDFADMVTGVAEWHINADEPDLLSYNSQFNNPAFYEPSPFASSDHDPLIIGIDTSADEFILA
ncbi:ExeM/NucH family extracellular endonuclease [Alphaproteobacteria bacterium KMM 3653]|uniref:ExeM/NucH family extracellular endonuclease n=1 Tax=Harenicola maris TaxID=2841044 RepID=A0AAP2G6R9_9RHOB|nr:ExeM/NucH family extracellular endonuclease [Harenicola maris]